MAFKSIIVDDTEHCWVCDSPYVEEHHCLHGNGRRKVADKYHLTIPLCKYHHTGSTESPHLNHAIDLAYQVMAQQVYEAKIGTREDFRRDFGKSYI